MVTEKAASFPLILTGDFNDVPDSEALANFQADTQMRSASLEFLGEELDFTTHKWRSEMTTRTIDYVWFAAPPPSTTGVEMNVIGTLSMIGSDKLPETGFPSVDHPSDHLALGYEFKISNV